jgi:hypothetical protein
MKHFFTIAILCSSLSFWSCSNTETEKSSETETAAEIENETDVTEEQNAVQLRNEIEQYRQTIENTKADLEKGTIDLSEARAEISQDWQKLDFYKSGDKVVRIKTYPSAAKGGKTEEFYFIDDQLVFALLENEGIEKYSMEDEISGEAFYYHNGEIIVSEDFEMSEVTEQEKSEMTQANKLQSEAKDYLQLVYESKD